VTFVPMDFVRRDYARTSCSKEHGPKAYVFGVFDEPVKSTKTAWKAACRRARVTGLHFHDLRREFGSRLLESGATLAEVQLALGHTNIKQTSTYSA
jgi:integrase